MRIQLERSTHCQIGRVHSWFALPADIVHRDLEAVFGRVLDGARNRRINRVLARVGISAIDLCVGLKAAVIQIVLVPFIESRLAVALGEASERERVFERRDPRLELGRLLLRKLNSADEFGVLK